VGEGPRPDVVTYSEPRDYRGNACGHIAADCDDAISAFSTGNLCQDSPHAAFISFPAVHGADVANGVLLAREGRPTVMKWIT
jgi:hypothetical protein